MLTKPAHGPWTLLLSVALAGVLSLGNPAWAGGKGHAKDGWKEAEKARKDGWKEAEKARKDFYKHQAKGPVGYPGYGVAPTAIPAAPYPAYGVQPTYGAGGTSPGIYSPASLNGGYPAPGYAPSYGANGGYPAGDPTFRSGPVGPPSGYGEYGGGGYPLGPPAYDGAYPTYGGYGNSQPTRISSGRLDFSGSLIWQGQQYASPAPYPR